MVAGGFPEAFLNYLKEAVGAEKAAEALACLEAPVSSCIRVNPAKPLQSGLSADMRDCHVSRIPWTEHGFSLGKRPVFTLDPCFHAGAYYVQDSSSMFIGELFGRIVRKYYDGRTPLRILDLCASPGGKTTDVASRMPAGSVLVSNEAIRGRTAALMENVALWGNPDVIVTNGDPGDFGERLKDFFDIILVDAPCSGEGMFRKDPSASEQWSEETVNLCASRQRRILSAIWPSLKEGGFLLYSTCTFNRKENIGNVSWMKNDLGAENVMEDFPSVEEAGAIKDSEGGYLFLWGLVSGEGQYAAAVRKTAGDTERARTVSRKRKNDRVQDRHKTRLQVPDGLFKCGNMVYALSEGGEVKAMTSWLSAVAGEVSSAVRAMSAGIRAGSLKGNDFVPNADLALSSAYNRERYPEWNVDKELALRFLAKESLRVPEGCPDGYLTVVYDGLPIGFVKNIGNRMNNLHPQSRRIRMRID